MGCSTQAARGSLRFSIGHGNDESQIDRLLSILPDLVERARLAVDA
jgi:cysteine desulfurase